MDKRALENFNSKLGKELKAGILSLLILNLIKAEKGPMYGYDIIKTLKAASDEKLGLQGGEIYPVLRMLQNLRILKSSWKNSPEGPPRKYYALTETGKRAVEKANVQWLEISTIVKDTLEKLKVIKK